MKDFTLDELYYSKIALEKYLAQIKDMLLWPEVLKSDDMHDMYLCREQTIKNAITKIEKSIIELNIKFDF